MIGCSQNPKTNSYSTKQQECNFTFAELEKKMTMSLIPPEDPIIKCMVKTNEIKDNFWLTNVNSTVVFKGELRSTEDNAKMSISDIKYFKNSLVGKGLIKHDQEFTQQAKFYQGSDSTWVLVDDNLIQKLKIISNPLGVTLKIEYGIFSIDGIEYEPKKTKMNRSNYWLISFEH